MGLRYEDIKTTSPCDANAIVERRRKLDRERDWEEAVVDIDVGNVF